MREIHEHYKQVKLALLQEQRIQSASKLLEMYKRHILAKKFRSVSEYMAAWSDLQTRYFSKVSGRFKYEEWSKFAMQTMATGVEQIQLSEKQEKFENFHRKQKTQPIIIRKQDGACSIDSRQIDLDSQAYGTEDRCQLRLQKLLSISQDGEE